MLTPEYLWTPFHVERFTRIRPEYEFRGSRFFRAYKTDGQKPLSDNLAPIAEEDSDAQTLHATQANTSINGSREAIDTARRLLKEKGFMVISQRAFDEIIAEKYAKAYEKARQETQQKTASKNPEGIQQAADTALSSLEKSIQDQSKNTMDIASKTTTAAPNRKMPTANATTIHINARLISDEDEASTSVNNTAAESDTLETTSDTQTLAQIIQHYETLLENERAQGQATQAQLSQWRQAQKALLLKAAIEPWAIDPELVFSLTEALFELQAQGGLTFVSASRERSDSEASKDAGTSVDLARFFEQFRAERPYLVKASASHGAGSLTETGAIGGKVAVTLEQLAELPMEQFIQAGGLTGNTRQAR